MYWADRWSAGPLTIDSRLCGEKVAFQRTLSWSALPLVAGHPPVCKSFALPLGVASSTSVGDPLG